MSLTDGHYEEKKTQDPSLVLLVLGLAVPISLVLVGMLGVRDRRLLVIPILILLAARIIGRSKRRRK